MISNGFKVVCNLIKRQAVTYEEAYDLLVDVMEKCRDTYDFDFDELNKKPEKQQLND
jgi:hypothetical protein